MYQHTGTEHADSFTNSSRKGLQKHLVVEYQRLPILDKSPAGQRESSRATVVAGEASAPSATKLGGLARGIVGTGLVKLWFNRMGLDGSDTASVYFHGRRLGRGR